MTQTNQTLVTQSVRKTLVTNYTKKKTTFHTDTKTVFTNKGASAATTGCQRRRGARWSGLGRVVADQPDAAAHQGARHKTSDLKKDARFQKRPTSEFFFGRQIPRRQIPDIILSDMKNSPDFQKKYECLTELLRKPPPPRAPASSPPCMCPFLTHPLVPTFFPSSCPPPRSP